MAALALSPLRGDAFARRDRNGVDAGGNVVCGRWATLAGATRPALSSCVAADSGIQLVKSRQGVSWESQWKFGAAHPFHLPPHDRPSTDHGPMVGEKHVVTCETTTSFKKRGVPSLIDPRKETPPIQAGTCSDNFSRHPKWRVRIQQCPLQGLGKRHSARWSL